MSSSRSRTPQCAACKILDRECDQQCVFAPHFPPDQPHRFEIVHQVFGATNAANFLNRIPAEMRQNAANTLVNEAQERIKQAESELQDTANTLLTLATQTQSQGQGTSQQQQLPPEFWKVFQIFLQEYWKVILKFKGHFGDAGPSGEESPEQEVFRLVHQLIQYEVDPSLPRQQELLRFIEQQAPPQQDLLRAVQKLIQKEIMHQLLDQPSDPPPKGYIPCMPELVHQEIMRKLQNQRSQMPQQEQDSSPPQPPQQEQDGNPQPPQQQDQPSQQEQNSNPELPPQQDHP